MRKERKAQILTVAVLLLVLGVVLTRQGAVQLPAVPAGSFAVEKTEATPQDTIYKMFDAARDGNVAAYLALHTGQMETSLRTAIQEQTEAGFAKYLRDTNAPIKGIALQQPDLITDREAKVRVEYVYQDRNEVQQVYLEKSNGKWKINRVDAVERIRTLVPYGTPVQ
ncbi:MAG: DUF4878 domain-containing protein [Bryobacterales bacterium]|nr:DUF4878 domain-containing protein [Bryobacterales bacterium]